MTMGVQGSSVDGHPIRALDKIPCNQNLSGHVELKQLKSKKFESLEEVGSCYNKVHGVTDMPELHSTCKGNIFSFIYVINITKSFELNFKS